MILYIVHMLEIFNELRNSFENFAIKAFDLSIYRRSKMKYTLTLFNESKWNFVYLNVDWKSSSSYALKQKLDHLNSFINIRNQSFIIFNFLVYSIVYSIIIQVFY